MFYRAAILDLEAKAAVRPGSIRFVIANPERFAGLRA